MSFVAKTMLFLQMEGILKNMKMNIEIMLENIQKVICAKQTSNFFNACQYNPYTYLIK